jgi:hypothetical protein
MDHRIYQSRKQYEHAGAGNNMNPSEQGAENKSKQEAKYGSAGAGSNEKIRQKVLKICK